MNEHVSHVSIVVLIDEHRQCLFCWIPAATYSPRSVRNSRSASGLKPTPSAPLLTSPGCHECQPVHASQQSTGLFRACGTGVHPPRRFIPRSGRSAPSCRKSSATRNPAWERENWQSLERRQKETPAFAGVSFCWIPAATYSPGPSPVKYHRRMKA